jgi:hypothetical protein
MCRRLARVCGLLVHVRHKLEPPPVPQRPRRLEAGAVCMHRLAAAGLRDRREPPAATAAEHGFLRHVFGYPRSHATALVGSIGAR